MVDIKGYRKSFFLHTLKQLTNEKQQLQQEEKIYLVAEVLKPLHWKLQHFWEK